MSLKSTARVIVTLRCNRGCAFCANKQPGILERATRITKLEPLAQYQDIVVTGGEPLCNEDYCLRALRGIHVAAPSSKVYMYIADYIHPRALTVSMVWLDGLTYTLHNPLLPNDLPKFYWLQKHLARFHTSASMRLKVAQGLEGTVSINFKVWNEVRTFVPRTDGLCEVPAHEDLYILEAPYGY
jgi:hypothetical protein